MLSSTRALPRRWDDRGAQLRRIDLRHCGKRCQIMDDDLKLAVIIQHTRPCHRADSAVDMDRGQTDVFAQNLLGQRLTQDG